MWQIDNTPGADWVRARYVFMLEKDNTISLDDEMAEHGDIYVIDKLPSYNSTEELVEHSISMKC